MPAKKRSSSAETHKRNSAAVEDYLERILELINTKGYARVVDIATRAMRKLTLTHARIRFRFGEMSYQSPSRFLEEMGGGAVATESAHRGSPFRSGTAPPLATTFCTIPPTRRSKGTELP